MNATTQQRNTAGVGEAARAGVLHQARTIYLAIFASPVGRTLIILLVAMTAAILVTTYGQLLLNGWNQPFYDAITRRDLHDFFYQLGVYFAIVSGLLVLDVTQRWINETIRYRLREGLTRDLVALWMMPRRAFWLATKGGPIGVNPDQRMTDDAAKLCDISTDLSIGLFRSSVLFVSFASVLWTISKDFSFNVNGVEYAIPGFMLWAAIAYSVVGSLLSYAVGRALVRLNSDRYAREADLRFALVDINEHIDGIALLDGEADERRRAETHLGNVVIAMRRLVRGLTNLTWVTAGFGWITGIAPILARLPSMSFLTCTCWPVLTPTSAFRCTRMTRMGRTGGCDGRAIRPGCEGAERRGIIGGPEGDWWRKAHIVCFGSVGGAPTCYWPWP